jgi:uncharacterized membrane protein (UPF0127 family)
MVRLTIDSGHALSERVRIATSFVARLRGLLGRREFAADEGLLLRPGGSIHTIGMRFPIDVIFLDGEMRVMRVCPHVSPWRGRIAPRGTRMVLELPAGRAAKTGLAIGQSLRPVSRS